MNSKNQSNEPMQPSQSSGYEQSQDSTDENENHMNMENAKSNADTTTSIADSLARVRQQMGEQLNMAPNQQSISLTILGLDQPVIFRDQDIITVGRMNPATNEAPDVDLGELPINVTGVSRMHLKLMHIDGQWFVEDAGSRNGTWLNGKLLMAYQRYGLGDGDQLRVGNVIILTLTQPHDAILDSQPISADRLRLTIPIQFQSGQGLHPNYMANHLMPYLNAITEMMYVVDQAKKRPQREIAIQSIDFYPPIVEVQFSCTHEMLQFMNHLPQLEQRSPVGEDTQLAQADNTSRFDVKNRAKSVAQHFADEHFLLMTSEQSEYYQHMLVPLLRMCVDSAIKIAT